MDRRRGFTLIELLVVIAIIALLTAILVPAMNQVRSIAKDAVCKSNLRQWGQGFYMYTDDNDGRMIIGWGMLNFGTGQPGFSVAWYNQMQNYIGEDYEGLWCCPVARKPGGYAHPGSIGIPIEEFAWSGYRGKLFYTPDTDPPWDSRIVWGSYCLNLWATYYDGPEPAFTEVPIPEVHWKGPVFYKGVSAAPIMTGGIVWNSLPYEFEPPPAVQGALATLGLPRHCINRHNGKTNALFFDWSVKSVKLKDLWTLKWHRKFNVQGPYTEAGGFARADYDLAAPWLNDIPQ